MSCTQVWAGSKLRETKPHSGLGKFEFIISIFTVAEMLRKPYAKWSASLSNILHVAVRACQLIMDFIANNNLVFVNNVPTKNFQRKLRNLINECNITICKEKKCKYINLNPSAPTVRGLTHWNTLSSVRRWAIEADAVNSSFVSRWHNMSYTVWNLKKRSIGWYIIQIVSVVRL